MYVLVIKIALTSYSDYEIVQLLNLYNSEIIKNCGIFFIKLIYNSELKIFKIQLKCF